MIRNNPHLYDQREVGDIYDCSRPACIGMHAARLGRSEIWPRYTCGLSDNDGRELAQTPEAIRLMAGCMLELSYSQAAALFDPNLQPARLREVFPQLEDFEFASRWVVFRATSERTDGRSATTATEAARLLEHLAAASEKDQPCSEWETAWRDLAKVACEEKTMP